MDELVLAIWAFGVFVVFGLWVWYSARNNCVVLGCERYGRGAFWPCEEHTCTFEGCGKASGKPRSECHRCCLRRGCNTHRHQSSDYCKNHTCGFNPNGYDACSNPVTFDALVCVDHKCGDPDCTNARGEFRLACPDHALCAIFKCDAPVVIGFDVCDPHLAEEPGKVKEIV